MEAAEDDMSFLFSFCFCIAYSLRFCNIRTARCNITAQMLQCNRRFPYVRVAEP